MIPYGKQSIDQSDIDAVVATLHSDWLTQGPAVPRFEQAVAARCGAAHAVAVCNATAALHIACLALGVGPGDRVWTSPNTFLASANCARYCGATVDFVDIDPSTWNMSPHALAVKLAAAAEQGMLPKVIIPVHFSGLPCAMEEIHTLAQQYGCRVIEDASHAIGATNQGHAVGNCRYSDITVFSFHPVKIITSGEGGMALTQDAGLARHMARLRSHGTVREAEELEDRTQGAWYYEQAELGFNYRLTDLQAALGHSQLQRLDDFLAARRRLAARYDELLRDLPLQRQDRAAGRESAHHLYPVRLKGRASDRRQIFEQMRAAGVGVHVHYIPVHLQPDFRQFGFARGDFPESERYYSEALSLPLFPDLSEVAQDQVIAALARCLK